MLLKLALFAPAAALGLFQSPKAPEKTDPEGFCVSIRRSWTAAGAGGNRAGGPTRVMTNEVWVLGNRYAEAATLEPTGGKGDSIRLGFVSATDGVVRRTWGGVQWIKDEIRVIEDRLPAYRLTDTLGDPYCLTSSTILLNAASETSEFRALRGGAGKERIVRRHTEHGKATEAIFPAGGSLPSSLRTFQGESKEPFDAVAIDGWHNCGRPGATIPRRVKRTSTEGPWAEVLVEVAVKAGANVPLNIENRFKLPENAVVLDRKSIPTISNGGK